jgi:hypothetical protein
VSGRPARETTLQRAMCFTPVLFSALRSQRQHHRDARVRHQNVGVAKARPTCSLLRKRLQMRAPARHARPLHDLQRFCVEPPPVSATSRPTPWPRCWPPGQVRTRVQELRLTTWAHRQPASRPRLFVPASNGGIVIDPKNVHLQNGSPEVS